MKDLPYDQNKWIYEQTEDKTNRFILGTKGEKTLICCGVNPSTASPGNLDRTVNRVERFAKTNGYDSFIMINLYPMRATKPKDMHKSVDTTMVKQNEECIASILSRGNCDIWAAWGVSIEKRKYLKDCLMKLVDIADTYDCKWYSVGPLTKDGHPRHPLYTKNGCGMDVFDMSGYVRDRSWK